jgi:hypothetical protein
MKTEYKKIAMRCTQEQFDSIKGRIPLPMVDTRCFEKNAYLVNFYFDKKQVTNLPNRGQVGYSREVFEIFDGEFFLDCCEREKRIIQYLGHNGKWMDFPIQEEVRIKPIPDHTAAIAELENRITQLKKEML